ncbi:MAG TPA: zinc ribbon domain-containing protein [Candidatus Poseidoniales archaeon]|jgi:uncharacterized membrane protein YvbJ|nr:zinc ribbon domain-containing protein [Candidatus Poseidoniaceae archaeon]RAH13029.1 MAG: hypothetical protein CMB05_002725 [Euryarchaeota archaeon]DAC37859.1 MAG TPA: zinc ribbon domain-containing protein [Candidatus Poseidoniales archaeon]HIH58206.1 zinc ribbon domain-containing protein [Candidatus Poseidoniaceae archaeon]
MAFCTNCGQMLADGTRFCRFCGSQQPSQELIARLRMEAEAIRFQMQQMQQANYGQQQNQQRW